MSGFNLLKCPRCKTRTVSGGRKICDRCTFELKKAAARDVARRIESERARYRRVQPRMPEIVQGHRIVAPEMEKPIIRDWWEVSYIGGNDVRRTEKHSDYLFAMKRYVILENLNAEGLQFFEVKGKVRNRIEL